MILLCMDPSINATALKAEQVAAATEPIASPGAL